MALKGDIVPLTNLFWIQVVDRRQSVKLVETGSYVAIFDVRQAAQVNNKFRTPALAGQFITRSLHISIGQAETFAGPAQPGARLQGRSGKIPWLAQTPNRHEFATFLLCFQNKRRCRSELSCARGKNRAPLNC